MLEKLPPMILVLESDEVASGIISTSIERNWFDALRTNSVQEAINVASVGNIHAAVISVRPDIDAALVAKTIRAVPYLVKTPIIFLLDAEKTINDYDVEKDELSTIIHRPFTPNELMATIKSLMRKSEPIFQDKIIRYRDIVLDLASYKVKRGERSIYLGPKEFKLLHLFIQFPKVVHSRKQIINHVWHGQDVDERTVDVHINRLRNLLKSNKEELPLIKTVRSGQNGQAGGYCLSLPGEVD